MTFPFNKKAYRQLAVCCLFLVFLLPGVCLAGSYPVSVTDASGNTLTFSEKPQRVVCLAPGITEMIVAFGQQNVLTGLTRHALNEFAALRTANVGGFFTPDADAIAACKPDLIIAAPSHETMVRQIAGPGCSVLILKIRKMEEAFSTMETIGRIFDCPSKAMAVIEDNRNRLALVAARVKDIPPEKRKRVARVMAGSGFFCPGDDSFQNEVITAAGGIVPQWGKNGFAVSVDPAAWQRFNPQMVYGCTQNKAAVMRLLEREEWKQVDAVRNGFIRMFPCERTCRVSASVGAFVQYLAATLYLDVFADTEKSVLENKVLGRRKISLDAAYVQNAQVINHRVADAEYKSLVIEFTKPMDLLSTLEGPLSGITAAGNTYIPLHASLCHMAYGIGGVNSAIAKNLGFSEKTFTTLMTGADMDNLSVQTECYKDLRVTVLATAGVRGNAQRMSKDAGGYYKAGTINIIIMANRRLTKRAMARIVITATEAKTAALLDLDVRSTYTSWKNRATGTGTDNMIVVQGDGPEEAMAGGHTKLGELVARTVHAAVTAAVYKQNGLAKGRSLFQRIAERGWSIEKIVRLYPISIKEKQMVAKLETLLADPYYAAFIETAFAVSDDTRKGLIGDQTFFDTMCRSVAEKLSGRPNLLPLESITSDNRLPDVISQAFGSLIAGIAERDRERKQP